ncbi:MAG TPA: YihY/virulence factor BrkB family protein [Acidimicrobiia bacterium]|nr:YihY/virulence factor BrkB family protein [Acidimicrobiia bacterium]
MKRFLEVFLGALAVGAAFSVATRQDEAAPAQSAGPATQADTMAVAAWAVAPPAIAGTSVSLDAPRAPNTAAGAFSLLKAVLARMKSHGTIMIAAGLSYYALLAVFPAAIAAVTIYGVVADPVMLEEQITELTNALPKETADFVGAQLTEIVNESSGSLGVVGIITIVAALWSASAGTKAIISGINYAYGVPETRKFLALRLSALLITFGIIIFGLAAAATVGFLPRILDGVGMGDTAATTLNLARWPFVFLVVVLGLGALYKMAPNRPWRMSRWINVGAIVAAIIWMLATVGLSVYVNSFGNFGATYGTLAGLIVLMLWFFVSGLVVLVGAELNSELEQRRRQRKRAEPDRQPAAEH